MTDYDANPKPLTRLPVRKHHECLVKIHASSPSPLSEVGTPCRVCKQRAARYTCPRCVLEYCCVACYRDHAESCTEGFYRDRVHSVVALDHKAKQQDTHQLLQRHFQFLQDQNEEVDEGDFTDQDRFQLLRLLALLEVEDQEGADDDQRQQRIVEFLNQSPNIKTAFERAIQQGEVSQSVLHSWHPWWKPQLVSSQNEAKESDIATTLTTTYGSTSDVVETLDERLLQIPAFSSLFKGENFPKLIYNLIDILFSIVLTFHQYHGTRNATSNPDTAVEAAMTLLQFSTVLREDARYQSLEEVMVHITQQHAQAQSSVNQKWAQLAKDVACLMEKRRYIGRALLEAIEILTVARRHVSCSKTQSDLKRKKRKLEFFLSWSQDYQVASLQFYDEIPRDIRAWSENWNLQYSSDKGNIKNDGEGQEVVAAVLPCSFNNQNQFRIEQERGRDRPKIQVLN